ncbi:L,D-transpeptidase family protein [Adhaeribacter aquaticus]|uniref:L,D-transpeptidase family protein n=1 Tax=Adhaeribacter aquaticus TaxID=299567 RepID=UPI00068558E0|nr:L,D-transpeptidase family protein [Adhaeribacter aquaticus]
MKMKLNFDLSNVFQIVKQNNLASGTRYLVKQLPSKGYSLAIGTGLIVLVSFLSAFTFSTAFEEKVAGNLQIQLNEKTTAGLFVNPAQRPVLTAALTELYEANNFKPLWLQSASDKSNLDSLLSVLRKAGQEGLQPATYHVHQLETLTAEEGLFSDAARVAELDQVATAAYLLYASHVYNGSISPTQLDANWHIKIKQLALVPHLQNALQTSKIKESLTELANVNPASAQLKRELANLRGIAEIGGWPTNNKIVVKNDANEAVTILKKRLVFSGDLDSTLSKGNLYDQAVSKAVEKFQKRHGLQVTGKVDQKTVNTLNVPVEKRIEQVIVNLERLRWQPRRGTETVIAVNIPEFKLRVYEANKKVLESRVVVGKTNFATPVFEDSLETIVFSPEWNVPDQIAREEILPQLQKSAGYLEKNNFLLYDSYSATAKPLNAYAINWQAVTPENFKYRIVQKANPKNALGAVKFLFPNPLNIYIHDTPAKQLFNENKRAYSHGCIRLENPGKLATVLLKNDNAWTVDKIQEKMNQLESTKVGLKKAVKVNIMYLTAFVHDGQLQFRDDVYGYDQAQLATLKNPSFVALR